MEGNQQLLALEIEHLTRRVGNSAVAVALELLPEGDGLGAAVEVNEGTGAVVVDPGAAMAGVEGGIEQGEGGGGLAPLPQLDGGFQLAVQGGVEQGLGLTPGPLDAGMLDAELGGSTAKLQHQLMFTGGGAGAQFAQQRFGQIPLGEIAVDHLWAPAGCAADGPKLLSLGGRARGGGAAGFAPWFAAEPWQPSPEASGFFRLASRSGQGRGAAGVPPGEGTSLLPGPLALRGESWMLKPCRYS